MNNHQRLAIHEAMIRLAQGDRGAFSAVFGGLWTPLLQFMQRALQGHPDIEDLAQQTLLKIFSRISDFDTTRDGVSWAFGIATYEVRTWRRTIQRRRETSIAQYDVALESQTPEDAVIVKDLQEALVSVLGRLSPAEQDALLGDDAPIGISAAAKRKRRQRALHRLRTIWGVRSARP
jgi:RNA polymerase sigma factor (sigma-70 family)